MRTLAFALLLTCLLAAACGGDDDDGSPSVSGTATATPRGTRSPAPASPGASERPGIPTGAPIPTPELELIVVGATWQSESADSIATLVDASSAVILGRVVRLTEQTTTGAGRTELPLSRFEVAVEQAVTGATAGGAITIEQVGGVTTREDGSQARVILAGDEALEPGRAYLFFLSAKTDGSLSSPPFARLKVGADGALQALPDWASVPVIIQLSGLTTEEALNEINSSIN